MKLKPSADPADPAWRVELNSDRQMIRGMEFNNQERFPRWIFNPRNKADLQYRTAHLSRFFLSRAGLEVGCRKNPNPSYVYASLMSAEDVLMARVSLWSMLVSEESPPRIVVGCDASLSKDQARSVFRDWPVAIDFLTIEEVADFHQNKNNQAIAWFCREHVFGFKLALNLMLAETRKVLYCDADVLWRAPVSAEIAKYDESFVYASIDFGEESIERDYFVRILEMLNLSDAGPPMGCAGVCVFNPGMSDYPMLEKLIELARGQYGSKRFTEQSIVAALAKVHNSYLSRDFIVMDDVRNPILPSWNSGGRWLGRHYAGPFRMQFWIDAAWLYVAHLTKPRNRKSPKCGS